MLCRLLLPATGLGNALLAVCKHRADRLYHSELPSRRGASRGRDSGRPTSRVEEAHKISRAREA
jgi:hypothetical protein